MSQNLGKFLDRIKPGSGVDLHFKTDGGYTIPKQIGIGNTAGKLQNNPWLRSLTISHRKHFSNPRFSSGWDIYIDQRFDQESYEQANTRG